MKNITYEMLHDEVAHEAVKRFEILFGVAAAIMVLYGLLYQFRF